MIDLRKWKGFAAAGGDLGKPAVLSHVAVHSTDVRPGSLFVALEGEHVDGHDYVDEALERGASFVLANRGKGLLVDDPLEALQEIAAAYRQELGVKVIAITGSYGKTVTKDLLASLLRERFKITASPESYNSQLGVALSILKIRPDDDFAVIEVGVSCVGEMDRLIEMVAPNHAILTCVGKAHLSGMGSLEVTRKEKSKLLEAASGWTIDESCDQVATQQSKRGDYAIGSFSIRFERPFAHLQQVLNQVVCAARLCGLCDEEIESGLKKELPRPIQTGVWRSPYGTVYVNDLPSSDPLSIERTKRLVSSHKDAILNHEDAAGDNRLTINLDRVYQNLETLRMLRPGRRIAAIVKANGYGTDAGHLAKFLEQCGVDLFGVAYVHEAVALRLEGIESEILVFHVAPYEAKQVEKWGLQAAISSLDLVKEPLINSLGSDRTSSSPTTPGVCEAHTWASRAEQTHGVVGGEGVRDGSRRVNQRFLKEPLINSLGKGPVHLHVDTGMSRLGCRPEEALELAKAIENSPRLRLEGVMTHLASPEQEDFTHKQLARFDEVLDAIERAGIKVPWIHAAATGSVKRYEIPRCNMMRIGIGLLEHALTLTSRITNIHELKAGDRVSYGGTYTVKRAKERIGVVPLGYFDGIHRHYSNRGYVMVHGKKAPIVGTVCMDFFMINLTDIPDANVHDPVLLFGEDTFGNQLSTEQFAKQGNTTAIELITCLGPRIQRIFIYEGAAREVAIQGKPHGL